MFSVRSASTDLKQTPESCYLWQTLCWQFCSSDWNETCPQTWRHYNAAVLYQTVVIPRHGVRLVTSVTRKMAVSVAICSIIQLAVTTRCDLSFAQMRKSLEPTRQDHTRHSQKLSVILRKNIGRVHRRMHRSFGGSKPHWEWNFFSEKIIILGIMSVILLLPFFGE